MKTLEELNNKYREEHNNLINQLFKDLKDNNISYYDQLDVLDYVFDARGDTEGIHHTNPELDQLIFDLWYDCNYERRSTITFQWQIECLKWDWTNSRGSDYYNVETDTQHREFIRILTNQYELYNNKKLEYNSTLELIELIIETLSRYIVEYGIQHRVSGFHWDW